MNVRFVHIGGIDSHHILVSCLFSFSIASFAVVFLCLYCVIHVCLVVYFVILNVFRF